MKAKHPKAFGTVLYVPNDTEGNAFLVQLKKYLNREHYTVRLRGRNPDRQAVAKRENLYSGTVRQSLRRHQSTYFAVYMDGKKTQTLRTEMLRKLYAEIGASRERILQLLNKYEPTEAQTKAAAAAVQEWSVSDFMRLRRKFRTDY
jgi:hypothetical protein